MQKQKLNYWISLLQDMLNSSIKIASHQYSTIPARSIYVGDFLTVQYIKSRFRIPSDIKKVDEVVFTVGYNVSVDLQDFLLEYRRRQYEMIQQIKCGLSWTAILLTYAPGSNTGNLRWMWLVMRIIFLLFYSPVSQ